MIEVTFRDLLNSMEAAKSFSQEKLPVKVSYRFVKILRKVDKELSTFEELRNKLLSSYGVISEDDLEARDKLSSEFNELLDTVVSIDLDPIPFEWLGDVNISPKELLSLDYVFSE